MGPSFRNLLVLAPALTCLALAGACDKGSVSSKSPDTATDTSRTAFENPGGMWMPVQMADHADQLKELGLAYDPAALTDPTQFPLGAVVSLGGYCSASFVSESGLLITNHHCSTSILQHNSTPEKNLMVDGYLAKEMKDELPGGRAGSVYVTHKVTDVTDKIVAHTAAITDPIARYDALRANRSKVAEACEEGRPNMKCSVRSFFEGAEYHLIEQLAIQDIRLVYAPHAGIGIFGGEIDNWRWPRHTGDWSFLRAYVAADGSSAAYAEDNVPYKPPHHLEVAMQGVDAGDFVMVAGYPGRTNRLKTAGEVRDATEYRYPRAIARFQKLIDVLEAAGKADPDLGIQVASTLRSLHNGLTNNKGMLDGLAKGGLADTKGEEEKKLREWIAADEERAQNYGTVLDDIEALNATARATRDADTAMNSLLGSSAYLQAALLVREAANQREKKEEERDPRFSDEAIEKMARSMEGGPQARFGPDVEKALVALALADAGALADDKRPALIDSALGETRDAAAVEAAIKTLYAKSRLGDGKALAKLLRTGKLSKLKRSKDPFIKLAMKHGPDFDDLEAREKAHEGAMAALRPIYVAALREQAGGKLAPDANSTLRLTYGTVRGYAPSAGADVYTPFTTATEMVAKHTGEEPFNAPAAILEQAKAKNYGPYAADVVGGDLPLDFLADLDITGGNSGSATLDKDGKLVGLAFDGNYEAMASDWIFMPEITRSIQVDIRYVLWVMDAVDDADHLITEMGLTPAID